MVYYVRIWRHNLKAYDETVDIIDPEDIATPRPPSQLNSLTPNNYFSGAKMSDDESTTEIESNKAHNNIFGAKRDFLSMKDKIDGKPNEETESSEGDEEDDDEDDEDESPPIIAGAYNPADFENLVVSPEIKELFQFIQKYTPQTIELETKLKPFIPEYIPAVGDIDAFIKVPRPDLKPDDLGLRVLDEPCAKQSDPTVLDLQLRALSKQTTAKQVIVRSIENAEKQPKQIDNWIKNISDLHRTKPPPSVHYSKNMPDVETLMQAWPREVEQLLKSLTLPTTDLDCNLNMFIDFICGILDIPIYDNRIYSLHLLFTVYNEFKNSQHFQSNDKSLL